MVNNTTTQDEKINLLWKRYNFISDTLRDTPFNLQQYPYYENVFSESILNKLIPKNLSRNLIWESYTDTIITIQKLDDYCSNNNFLSGRRINLGELNREYSHLEFVFRQQLKPATNSNSLQSWNAVEPSNGDINNNAINLLRNTIPFSYDMGSNSTYKYKLYYSTGTPDTFNWNDGTWNNDNMFSATSYWILDNESGFLFFMGGTIIGSDTITLDNYTNNWNDDSGKSPPFFSYIRYVGDTGFDNVEMSGNIKINGTLDLSNNYTYNDLSDASYNVLNLKQLDEWYLYKSGTSGVGIPIDGSYVLEASLNDYSLDLSVNNIDISGNIKVNGTLDLTNNYTYNDLSDAFYNVLNLKQLDEWYSSNLDSNLSFNGSVTFNGNTIINDSSINNLEVSNNLLITGNLITNGIINAQSSGLTHYLGNAEIGVPNLQQSSASFKFKDLTSSEYAIAQNSDGLTAINCASDQRIDFAVNNQANSRISFGQFENNKYYLNMRFNVIKRLAWIEGNTEISGGFLTINNNQSYSNIVEQTNANNNVLNLEQLDEWHLFKLDNNLSFNGSVTFNGNTIINDSSINNLEVSNNLLITNGIINAQSSDSTHYLGNAEIGFNGPTLNSASFKFKDLISSEFAIAQNSNGLTVINCASDQTIDFAVNNQANSRISFGQFENNKYYLNMRFNVIKRLAWIEGNTEISGGFLTINNNKSYNNIVQQPNANNNVLNLEQLNEWYLDAGPTLSVPNLVFSGTNVGIGPNDMQVNHKLDVNGGMWGKYLRLASPSNNMYDNTYDGTYRLSVSGKAYLRGLDMDGGWSHSSDDRIKHNEIIINNGLEVIRQLIPQKYQKTTEILDDNFYGDLSGYEWYYESGLIAQSILKIDDLSYVVKYGDYIDESGNNIIRKYAVSYNDIHIYNIAAVKELDTIVQNQQIIINNQQKEITNLKKENSLIKLKLNEILSELGKQTI